MYPCSAPEHVKIIVYRYLQGHECRVVDVKGHDFLLLTLSTSLPRPHARRYQKSPFFFTVPSDAYRRCARRPLALMIWTRALDGDADQRAPVGRHRPVIIVPIRMFPG